MTDMRRIREIAERCSTPNAIALRTEEARLADWVLRWLPVVEAADAHVFDASTSADLTFKRLERAIKCARTQETEKR